MEAAILYISLAALFGIFMAWGIGANDVANAMATSVGSKALTIKQAIVVDRLPKTRSGKILRGTMRKIAEKQEYTMPATIEDPAVLGEIADELK